MSIMTLLVKKEDKTRLENYRPISSLLKSDYKILAKILANRLKKVIGKLVSNTQAYSILKRDISGIVLSMKYILKHMHITERIHVSVDFSKAIDRVEHEFLWGVLGKCGFGSNFTNWLKQLYSSATSKVKCKGLLTGAFLLKRSVRQGCPLSSLLYSLVAEPLGALLKQNRDIKGVMAPSG